jgi:pantetheine-phosphate adenylyltransferase
MIDARLPFCDDDDRLDRKACNHSNEFMGSNVSLGQGSASKYRMECTNVRIAATQKDLMSSKKSLMDKKAVYPGSFDPITNGHVDIIYRGLKVFDRIVVAVLTNPKKSPLFSIRDRVEMIGEIFDNDSRVEVTAFQGLLIDFTKKRDATVVIRGLRAVSDFEYEFQMALMNRKLNPEIETFFMMPSLSYTFLSSNLVKEVSMLGGCLKGLVPDGVAERLLQINKSGEMIS